MLFRAGLLIFAGITNLVLASIVASHRPLKRQNIFFFLIALGLGGWAIGIAGFLLSNSQRSAYTWATFYYSMPLVTAFTLPFFAVAFPNDQRMKITSRILLVCLFVPAILITITSQTSLFTAYYVDAGNKGIDLAVVPYLIYTVSLLGSIVYGLAIIILKARKLKGYEKHQAKYFYVGFLITSVFGVFFNLILPWLGNYRYIWIGPLFTNVFLLFNAYNIIKHRLFNLTAAAVRTLAYLASAVSLGLLVSVILSVGIENNAANLDNKTRVVLQTLIIVMAAMLFPVLKHGFDAVTQKLFFRGAYDPQSLLNDLNSRLVASDVGSLASGVVEVIMEHINVDQAALYISEDGDGEHLLFTSGGRKLSSEFVASVFEEMNQTSTDVLYVDSEFHPKPIQALINRARSVDIVVISRLIGSTKIKDKNIGLLMLGSKSSGKPYSDKELKLIEVISREISLALENILSYEQIENFNETLQDKIHEATRELKASNKKLMALDEAKDEFVSMASHQLRTPLTSIKGYVSMVYEGDAGEITEAQKKMLGQALFSSQRMVYLISDLLNVSRLKTGKFNIDSRPVNLAEIIDSELSQLREGANGKSIELIFEKPKDFPIIELDEMKIRQVIMNFTDNAIYYTPSGGKITIELKDKSKNIEFTVKDTGIGVPKADQHRLFTKFYRAANAKKTRPDGTGIGLFMARKVIVAQGGSLIFTSQEGKGSTFGFSFPKNKSHTDNNKTPN